MPLCICGKVNLSSRWPVAFVHAKKQQQQQKQVTLALIVLAKQMLATANTKSQSVYPYHCSSSVFIAMKKANKNWLASAVLNQSME